MHTDYILYVIAVICFIVAGYTAAYPFTSTTSNDLTVIVLAIIGIIFIGSGYSLRPQTRVATRAEPSIPQMKPVMEERSTPPPPTESSPKPEPMPAAEPMTSAEAVEEPKKEEITTPPEAPAETSETKTETKKPVRKRRERKEG